MLAHDGQLLPENKECASVIARSGRALRVGFIAPVAGFTSDSVSGMPYQMRRALGRYFPQMVTLQIEPSRQSAEEVARALRVVVRPILRSAREPARRVAQRVSVGVADLIPGWSYRQAIRESARSSLSIQHALEESRVDVLFGCCISAALVRLQTKIPIVYCSDTTAKLLNGTYPEAMRRCRGYKRACDELEGAALEKCAAAVFASEHVLVSAVSDYGLDPIRGHVVPMGANVLPEAEAIPEPQSPKNGRLRLCIAAADPVRKRLDLAIRATELLCQRGWHAELVHIGPPTRRSLGSKVVIAAGRLRLSEIDDRRKHQEILATSHLMILPSCAEAFGIAPCEAAHFARPSIVSAAGGLPSVVEHGVTGLVMPIDATAANYAGAIDDLMRDKDRYLAMCHAALARAHRLLSWERWAEGVAKVIRETARKFTSPAVAASDPFDR
jgi:glycosyltransferase involved in cell wall biosynthesis